MTMFPTDICHGVSERDFLATLGIDADAALDQAEVDVIAKLPTVQCPTTHLFADRIYRREILMPAGTLLTSKTHGIEHFFEIKKGVVSVWSNGGVEVLSEGHSGRTLPNTRRLLYVWEDCVWVTFHPNPDNLTDVTALEKQLMVPHQNSIDPQLQYANSFGQQLVALTR